MIIDMSFGIKIFIFITSVSCLGSSYLSDCFPSSYTCVTKERIMSVNRGIDFSLELPSSNTHDFEEVRNIDSYKIKPVLPPTVTNYVPRLLIPFFCF